MKLKGFFEKVLEHKKEGSTWVNIYGDFKVSNETDVVRVRIPRTKDWCLEHGMKTGAAGEINLKCGYNDRGYYEQNVWGFKTQEQLANEEAEREAKKAAQPKPQEKTPEMQEAADARMEKAKEENATDPEASKNLPF